MVTFLDSPRISGLSGAATPTQDSNHGDELRSLNPNLQGASNKKRRCRDFDGEFTSFTFKFLSVVCHYVVVVGPYSFVLKFYFVDPFHNTLSTLSVQH